MASTQPIPTDITVLKQLTAIRLDVSIWSARRKLTPSDFGVSDLPPEHIASLGCKKVCNPEDLRIFATLKARAVSLLDRNGVRFLGGWAIPETAISTVIDGLDAIAADFTAAKNGFLGRYEEAVRQWIASNPGWEHLIANAVVGADTVRARLNFGWQMFKVAPPRKGDAARPLRDAVSNLGASLYGEVAKVADEAWHKSFAGKADVTTKALSPLRSLRQKLAGLSFVEPRVTPVVDLLDIALASVTDKGPITGANLVMLQGLVCLLRDPAALVEHGQRIIEGQTPEDALRTLVALPPQGSSALAADESIGDEDDDGEFEPIAHEPMPVIDSLGLW